MNNKFFSLILLLILTFSTSLMAKSNKNSNCYMIVYHMEPIDVLTYGAFRMSMVKEDESTKVKKITRKRKIKRFVESVENFDKKQTGRFETLGYGYDLRVVVEVYEEGKCVFSCGFTGNGMLQYNNKCYLRDENSVRLLESYVPGLKFLDFNLEFIDFGNFIENN